MRVILLAAGLGTRLRPLTDQLPKCLVSIGGRPLLEIWLEQLTDSGFGPFLVNTHYLKDQVYDFVKSSRFRSQVELVEEPVLLGTAGTLRANLDFFQESDGMLVHADNYCRADFGRFQRAHQCRAHGCIMTMMTFRTHSPSSCGVVEVDSRGVVTGFYEKVKNPPTMIANGAVYILSRELLADFPSVSDMSTEVLPRYVGEIQTYHTEETFIDIGTPEAYERACQSVVREELG